MGLFCIVRYPKIDLPRKIQESEASARTFAHGFHSPSTQDRQGDYSHGLQAAQGMEQTELGPAKSFQKSLYIWTPLTLYPALPPTSVQQPVGMIAF